MTSTNQKAQLYELQVLEYIARAGWLRTSDISKAVWGLKSNPQMARRTLARLLAQRFVVSVRGPDLSNVFALSKVGAKYLNSISGKCYKATASLINSLHNYRHRCVANLLAIYHSKNPNCTVWFEFEIQSGKLPIINIPSKNNKVKMPDYFVYDEYEGSYWGEIEISKKSTRDRLYLVAWLFSLFNGATELPEIGRNMYIRQVEFIASEEFERSLLRWVTEEFIRRGSSETEANQQASDFCGYWTIVRGL